jgi:DNA-binding IclR family transcriptional regulator
MDDTPRTIDAVRFTCGIIDYLSEEGDAGITEIADEFDRSKSSAHAYLTTLTEESFVVKENGRYSLGLHYLELAESVKKQIDNYEVIESEIDDIAEKTGEVAQFATLEGDDLVYLYKAYGDSAVETLSSIGSREAPHCTALGKAILSQMDESAVRETLGPAPFPSKTSNTITDYDALFEELELTRERGYAIDAEENIMGLVCVAAPVVLDDGTILGALSVSGPSSRLTQERIEDDFENEVTSAANVIQINVTFS